MTRLSLARLDPCLAHSKKEYAQLYAQLFSHSCMITIRWWIESCPQKPVEEVGILLKNIMENGFFQTYRNLIEVAQPKFNQ